MAFGFKSQGILGLRVLELGFQVLRKPVLAGYPPSRVSVGFSYGGGPFSSLHGEDSHLDHFCFSYDHRGPEEPARDTPLRPPYGSFLK